MSSAYLHLVRRKGIRYTISRPLQKLKKKQSKNHLNIIIISSTVTHYKLNL